MPLISRAQMLKQMEHAQPFSIQYRTIGGELNTAENVVWTNTNHKNKTINIKHENGEFRTIRHILIIEFNHMEVYL